MITTLIRLSLQGTQRYSHQQRADGDVVHKGPRFRCGAEVTEPIGIRQGNIPEDILGKMEHGRERHF